MAGHDARHDGSDELLAHFAALHRAVRDRDELERLLRDRAPDPDPGRGGGAAVRELSLAACEQVLARRSALYRCLIRHGWTPPEPAVRHLLEDEVLLGEPLGGAGG